MKITYSVAASLDGFIAREDGDVSWLDEMDVSPTESSLEEFFQDVDGLVMGRKTYEFIFNYGSWPYGEKPSWVITSHTPRPLAGANLMFVRHIDDVISEARKQDVNHLWLLGGGQLASSFLTSGWITNIVISEMPIELGSGIPVFSSHLWQHIPCRERCMTEKQGFRQIEMVLAPST